MATLGATGVYEQAFGREAGAADRLLLRPLALVEFLADSYNTHLAGDPGAEPRAVLARAEQPRDIHGQRIGPRAPEALAGAREHGPEKGSLVPRPTWSRHRRSWGIFQAYTGR